MTGTAPTPATEPQKVARKPTDPKVVMSVVLRVFGLLASIYVFLIGLTLMGDAFKCLGGKGAGSLFRVTNNPIAGLMVGILATVLVQSSSTSTSIVVGLVGASQISVHNAIPVIMGANIGTSVTNTIVSMTSMGDRLELERSFAGATVHDMFNFLSVLVLLPLELIVEAISGEGGIIYWVTKGLTEALMTDDPSDSTFPSPVKAIVGPIVDEIMKNDKYVISALSLGQPAAKVTPENATLANSCKTRRLGAESELEAAAAPQWDGWRLTNLTALVSADAVRRLAEAGPDCSSYYCVNSDVAKNWKKISSTAFAAIPKCSEYINTTADLCGKSSCYLDVPAFYADKVEGGTILTKGVLSDVGDVGGGIIALVLSLIFLCGALIVLVKILHSLLIGHAKRVIEKAVNMNDYVAIVIGALVTMLVQSSSVTTSALTPLCGVGVLKIEKMLPLTLGANIGTTITGLLAALAVMKASSLQIALCHLFFNIFGILIWFPVPLMRQFPVGAAKLLGLYASYYRFVPLCYILVAFVALPAVALLVSLLYGESVAGGVVVTLLLLALLAGFVFWWVRLGGCYRAPSEEQRAQHALEWKERLEKEGAEAKTKIDEPEANVLGDGQV